jgi:hypothetical protein
LGRELKNSYTYMHDYLSTIAHYRICSDVSVDQLGSAVGITQLQYSSFIRSYEGSKLKLAMACTLTRSCSLGDCRSMLGYVQRTVSDPSLTELIMRHHDKNQ